MKRLMFKGFTLVELLVVITIIMILATFVSLNLVSAKKTARDNKRISDAQVLASALDQYAASKQRLYPCPNSSCAEGDLSTSSPVEIKSPSTIYQNLKDYINPVPTEIPSLEPSGYKYVYVYRNDGRKASIIVTRFETGDSSKLCNVTKGDPNLPPEVTDYLNKGGLACYYVSR